MNKTNNDELKQLAQRLYCLEGKTIKQISLDLKIRERTLYGWRKAGSWDSKVRTGNIDLSINLESQVAQIINQAIADGKLGDPVVADTLSKLLKISKSLRPEKQLLGNIYVFLEATTEIITNINNPAFTELWQKHLITVSDVLRSKFTKD